MLSVLIPVYNYDLRPLVNQLLGQIAQLDVAVEILIRDDGSTQWASENRDLEQFPAVRYSANDTNLGRSATRQALAEDAQYNQLLFLDADVLPVNDDYLKTYLEHPMLSGAIGCGGVSYQDMPPPASQMLRYVYGLKRESLAAIDRQKTAYMVLAANLWISKELFFELNDNLENFYGDDLVLSQKIRAKNLEVIHLDNPVYHLGLESSEAFLDKTVQMIRNLVRLELEGTIDKDLMRLQRAYLNIKAKGLAKPYLWATKQLLPGMKRNLLGNKPSMKTFDAYKLYLYIKLKNND